MEAKNPTAAAALSAHSAGAAGTSGMETSPTGNPPLPVVKPIHAAAMYGEVDTLAAILERDPMALEARDSRGYTPLMCAVENVDALEMVRQLVLNHAADVNAALVSCPDHAAKGRLARSTAAAATYTAGDRPNCPAHRLPTVQCLCRSAAGRRWRGLGAARCALAKRHPGHGNSGSHSKRRRFPADLRTQRFSLGCHWADRQGPTPPH